MDDIMVNVLGKDDLSAMSQEERTQYYRETCKSIGLNPLTRPLDYITLNGKLTLYARRDAADQLRKIHNISIEIVERVLHQELFTVHVRARDGKGRSDEDLGVVTVGGLKGEARANAILKAITKAKRRVTLSISGLGFLDETEVEDIPAPKKEDVKREWMEPHYIHPVTTKFGGVDWVEWGKTLIDRLAGAASSEECERWMEMNAVTLASAAQKAPKAHGSILRALGVIKAAGE
ncbi:MAG TPA: hypothetical protein VKT70_08495 [Stellaceae bacterium]|nr:hypothetical protein [Stellaceae bacterium]